MGIIFANCLKMIS